MQAFRKDLLTELANFGRENDQAHTAREAKMLNITPDTGPFLALLVKTGRYSRILEIGTSNGYSTIWLADAAGQTGGRVTTLERSAAKAALAHANFERAQVEVELVVADADEWLPAQTGASFDFIFLDSDRGQYAGWWPVLQRLLMPGGLIVADNAVSHAAEMQAFIELTASAPGFDTALVPVGNGEWLIRKEA